MDPEAYQVFMEDKRKYTALFLSTRKNAWNAFPHFRASHGNKAV
jgi:hypothetical protein